jgi:hypothetical protein
VHLEHLPMGPLEEEKEEEEKEEANWLWYNHQA